MVQASYHTFWLVDTAHLPDDTWEDGNGLVAVTQPGAAVIITGVHTGAVSVTVDVQEARPQTSSVSAWDEVVEVSLEVPDGHLKVAAPAEDIPDELPELTPSGPGNYRLRVHARGRDTYPDGAVEEPVEDYLLVIWPEEGQTSETVLRSTDRYGAELREGAAARTERPPVQQESSEAVRRRREREEILRRS